MDNIKKLQEWYIKQCNGEWDHLYGITIETLDNPGWSVQIDLEHTGLENNHFQLIAENVSPEFIKQSLGEVTPPYDCAEPQSDTWMLCFVKNKKFSGAGSPEKLEKIVGIFLEWA